MSQRHFATQTLCRRDILTLLEKKDILLPKTYSHPDVLPPIFFGIEEISLFFFGSVLLGDFLPPPPPSGIAGKSISEGPPLPPELLESPTVRRLSNNFRGGGEASKGRLWLVKVKLLKLCRTTLSYPSELLCALVV